MQPGPAKSHCDRTQGCRTVNGRDSDGAIGVPDGLELIEGPQGLDGLGPVSVDLGHDHVVADRVLEGGRGTFCHQPARGDDPYPISEGVGLLEVLGGQEDRHAKLAVEPPDLGPDRYSALGVESRGGLVEKQHFWVVDQRGGEVETPLHSPRIRADAAVDGGSNVDQVKDLREPNPHLGGTQPVEATLQREQFAPGLSFVNGRVLERDADPQADRSRFLRDVVPCHRGRPRTGLEQRAEDSDHGSAEVFAERGFHGASLDEVAAVAGFTKGAVYSNFKNKEDLFLALFRANYEREILALRATLEDSKVPPEARLSDFVELIRDETRRAGNMGLLYQEFWLYAARNPAARAELTRIDDEGAQALAEIIEEERVRQGIEPLESAVQVARLIEILFRGIGQLRVLQPDVADDELVEAAISFVARGLGAFAPSR